MPVVAATKLSIPRSRRSLVARPDLEARLDGEYRVGLVSAPAGYGKTSTLASWAARRGPDVAWLSCDALDAEPTRFVAGLLATISAAWPGTADDAIVLLERNGATTHDPAVAAANELTHVDAGGIIVVDDLHLAAPEPAMLAAFIHALPPRFRFVVGTRADPPLSLARLRLRGELLDIRSDDLRFGRREMDAFFALADVQLDVDEVSRLHELTEGWPAATQLAAIALQRGIGRHDFLEAFASTDRGVGEFLLTEVLASLPPDLVDFLVETSVLEVFDAELCVAMTGVADAGALLDRALAANLFVVPLDEPANWFRYHHLFGAFLRARLASLGQARLRTAHERASRVLEERGQIGVALRHAMAIGATDRIGQILRTALTRSMSVSELADDAVRAARHWLYEVGASAVTSDPVQLLEVLIGLIGLTRPADAPGWLERVRLAHPDADGNLVALIEGAYGEYHQNLGQPLAAIRHLELAWDAVGGRVHDVGLVSLLPVATARAHIQAGRFDRAGVVLAAAHDHPSGNALADEARNRGVAAFVAAVDGELARVVDLVRATTLAADRLGLGVHEVGRIYAGLAMVELHLERHEHAPAHEVMEGVLAAADSSHRMTVQSLVTLQRARLARTCGDEAGAAALLTDARLYFAEPDDALRQVFGEEAVAQAFRFDPPSARSLLGDLHPGHPVTNVLRTRLALFEGDARTAAALLDELGAPRTRRERVEREVLHALSVLHRDVERANAHLEQALAAGRPEWLLRTVIDAGPDVRQLLASYTPRASEVSYVDSLLSAIERDAAPVRATAGQALVDPLSRREVMVLRHLCTRLTYQEIATTLSVSLNTLKSHVRAVYRKLDVGSRADAVAAGRRLGLI